MRHDDDGGYAAQVGSLYPSVTEDLNERVRRTLERLLPSGDTTVESWLVRHAIARALAARLPIVGPWLWLQRERCWSRQTADGVGVACVALPSGRARKLRAHVYFAPFAAHREKPLVAAMIGKTFLDPHEAAQWCDQQLRAVGAHMHKWTQGPLEPMELAAGLREWKGSDKVRGEG